MKRIALYILAVVAGVTAVSCVREDLAVYDDSQATAPIINSYALGDKNEVIVTFTPAVLGQTFNKQMPVYHSLVLLSADGKKTARVLTSSEEGNTITVTERALSRGLATLGYVDGDVVAEVVLSLRASLQEQARDNGRNGYVESVERVTLNNVTVVLPQDSPYKEYTKVSDWTVIGSIASFEMSWDKDLVMWTDDKHNHVAAHVALSKDDEFKFRKEKSWDVNMGGEFGGMDTEFDIAQDGANIKVGEDGIYDIFFNDETKKAWVSEAFDPYPAYKQSSNWTVIGALKNYSISWDDDIEMISDGTSHLALSVSLDKEDEFKFRQDKAWTVNLGGEFGGLGSEFPVTQDGANIKVGEEGIFDLIVNPEAGTAMISEASGAKVSYLVKEAEPEPEPEPEVVKGWNIIGLNGDWDNDVIATQNGNEWIAYITATDATEFKWRKDAGWDENYGGSFVAFGQAFDAVAGGDNIPIPAAGFYKVVLDTEALTITIYDNFTVWSLIGDFNSWAGDVDMIEVDGKWIAEDVELSGGWKIRMNHDWGENRGGAFAALGEPFAVTAGGDNIDCGEGKFTVVYDPAEETITVKEGTVWSLIGDFNSWGADVDMVESDGKWMAEGVELSGGWKLRKNHDWGENRGGEFVAFNEPFAVTNNGANINCGEGKFTVVYDPAEETITVSPATYGWSLIGVNGDWGTDIDMVEVMPGIWMSSVVEITSEGWKIRYNHDWGVNRGSADMNTEGVFVKAIPDGGNIPLTGTFKVVYNASNETIGTLVWGVVGSINGWSGDVPMNLTPGGIWCSLPVTLAEDDEIKIRKYADWGENFGGTFAEAETAFEAVAGGANIKAPAGTYMVVYDAVNGQITLSQHFWGVVGEFSSWGGDPDVFMMPIGEGKWAAYGQQIAGPWKIRQNYSWDSNYGGTFVELGTAFEAVGGGDNITVDTENPFDIIFDEANGTITVQ